MHDTQLGIALPVHEIPKLVDLIHDLYRNYTKPYSVVKLYYAQFVCELMCLDTIHLPSKFFTHKVVKYY
ncbi:hypothetical protein Lalb_Chr01g0003301 [Lupinus albus]|uniref:Uncharacterized protein n=1 Tax=Lupinus albus TaxID=3870 RepID=A0A6A4R344_LUPAL|nr:hypothetical protein Lalb_Chr01g0003301 [Lupinus albus]